MVHDWFLHGSCLVRAWNHILFQADHSKIFYTILLWWPRFSNMVFTWYPRIQYVRLCIPSTPIHRLYISLKIASYITTYVTLVPYRVLTWLMFGSYMVHVWFLPGLCLVLTCLMFDFYLVYVWFLHGSCLVFTWFVFGSYMVNL